MGKDCFFSFSSELIPFIEDFCETRNNSATDKFIVSNSPIHKESYAPEINFYINNSPASNDEKATILRNLYISRMDRFDFSKQSERKTSLNKTVALISESGLPDLTDKLIENGFTVLQFHSDSMATIKGEIGHFILPDNTTQETVAFVISENLHPRYEKRPGCYNPEHFSIDELTEELNNFGTSISCNTEVHCQKSNCIRYTSGDKFCNACIEACPQQALEAESDGSITIMHSTCIGCGRCVSACPTGAMESATLPRSRMHEITGHFKGYTLLVLPERVDLENFSQPLPDKLIPFPVKDECYFDEETLLALCQTTGRQPILYVPDELDPVLKKRIDFVNSITEKSLYLTAIQVCTGKESLRETLAKNDFSTSFERFSPYGGLSKRQDLAQRIENIIHSCDFGTISTPAEVPFGAVTINPDNCTLCLSCAGKCPMNALVAYSEDQTLRFMPSLCVQCGACADTCPEKDCLQLTPNKLSLSPLTFSSRILAKDELFPCIECGKEFAPKKAVDKIINKMSGHFSNEPVKLRSMSCCPDCKAKLMLQQQLSTQAQGIAQ